MLQNYQTTKTPSTVGTTGADVAWTNQTNAKVEDGNTADCGFIGPGFGGGDPNQLDLSNFGFDLPDFAIIDGVSIAAKVQTTDGATANDLDRVYLLSGIGPTDIADTPDNGQVWSATLGFINHGESTSLWGRTWTVADINDSDFGLSLAAIPGSGTSNIHVDVAEITVYWHVDITTAPADVPIRVDYKVYSRDGRYLGNLPKVSSPFGFSQDINSAGSVLQIVCGYKAENTITTSALLTDDDDEILTDDDLPILAESTDIVLAEGASANEALFKNSNRVKVWVYNYWNPNGKLEFSGQINKVGFKDSVGNNSVRLLVLSDGVDLNNFIARGYPFSYTTDVSQTGQNGYVTVSADAKSGGGVKYGQTWITGGSVTNVGAIVLKIQGTAKVKVSVWDGPNGNFIGSISMPVTATSGTDVQFEVAQLLGVNSSDEYFFSVSVLPGESIRLYKHSSSLTYTNGSMYVATYSGGGGGSFTLTSGDLYFVTKYGAPTTTTTYSTDDPVTEMMSSILIDYNNRGGYVTERNFLATGLSITYMFNQATIYEALRKVIELSPTGYYSYIDLGTAEMDILQQTYAPDFTVVRGSDVNELDLELSIENVKNYLLFSGGETAPNVNLYRDYQDSESAGFYGLRTVSRTDNRVTNTGTADAIGDTFIEENSDETQETTLTIPVTAMDISLLVPGKNIGFMNFGDFIDGMVLQIVRRDYSTKSVTLSLGRLPIRMNDQVQRINRGLLNEQTINNPTAPS